MTNASNCGDCDIICLNGKTCQTGQCACPAGLTECMGQCVNSQTDPNNCGGCGVMCGPAQACVASVCRP